MKKPINLTEKSILLLAVPKRGKVEYSVPGAPGLRLVISCTGSRRWMYRYRYCGRKYCVNMGLHPGMNVADAKKEATRLKSMVIDDVNPAVERTKRRENPTVAEFCRDDFIPHARAVQRNPEDTVQKLESRILPFFGEMRLLSITRADFERFRAACFEGVKPATLNRYHACIHRVLSYALELGLIENHPLAGVKKRKESGVQEVFLSPAQSARLMDALDRTNNLVIAGALKLLILTGMRKGEVLPLRWEQVDLEAGYINLKQTKSGKPQRVVLSDDAKANLEAMRAYSIAGNDHVFPCLGSRTGHVVELRNTFNLAINTAKLKIMRIHDIRHTFASQVVVDHSLYVAQHLLRHNSPAMTQRYAHLADKTLKEAANTVGRNISGTRA